MFNPTHLMHRFFFIVAVLLSITPVEAAPTWKTVFHTTTPKNSYNNHIPVKTLAEQATLVTESVGNWYWWGYGGPTNIHTRLLRFICKKVTCSVPELFVRDLLDLKVDQSVHATVEGKDVVFTLTGSGGEKYYKVHFHFHEGRLFQRILVYSENEDVYILTNAEAKPMK